MKQALVPPAATRKDEHPGTLNPGIVFRRPAKRNRHLVPESLHAAFGDRFWVSQNQQRLIDAGKKGIWEIGEDGKPFVPQETLDLLEFGDTPISGEELLTRTQDALAEEIGLMLDEGVVAAAEDIDLCMILGAGWPMYLGGITPYLDRVGASERVNGKRFHAPGVASRA